MKGNKKLLVIAALVLLITVCYTTYAIYKTSASADGEVTAAIWDVTFKDGSTEITDNYTITFSGTDCQNNAHVKDGVIAPGATCSKTITLDAGQTEVDVVYSATIGTVTAEDGSGSAISTTNANAFSASLDPSSGSIGYSAEGAARQATLTLTVTWAGTDDSDTDTINDADTALSGAIITVPITLVAKQQVGNS